MPDKVLHQVREACAQCPPRSQAISSSTYAFDLDRRLLQIEDRDFVFIGPTPQAGRFAHALTVPVKAIRATAENIVLGVHQLSERIDSDAALLVGNPLPGATLSVSDSDGLKQVTLDLGPRHQVGIGSKFRIDISYRVRLPADGPQLMFAGAIQPSDYLAAKESFGLETARKTIHLVVQRATPFHGYLFDPAAMNYFPVPQQAVAKHGVFVLEHRIEGPAANWMRATYFAVSVPC